MLKRTRTGIVYVLKIVLGVCVGCAHGNNTPAPTHPHNLSNQLLIKSPKQILGTCVRREIRINEVFLGAHATQFPLVSASYPEGC